MAMDSYGLLIDLDGWSWLWMAGDGSGGLWMALDGHGWSEMAKDG